MASPFGWNNSTHHKTSEWMREMSFPKDPYSSTFTALHLMQAHSVAASSSAVNNKTVCNHPARSHVYPTPRASRHYTNAPRSTVESLKYNVDEWTLWPREPCLCQVLRKPPLPLYRDRTRLQDDRIRSRSEILRRSSHLPCAIRSRHRTHRVQATVVTEVHCDSDKRASTCPHPEFPRPIAMLPSGDSRKHRSQPCFWVYCER